MALQGNSVNVPYTVLCGYRVHHRFLC